MLITLEASLSVQHDEYPGELALRFDVFKKHKETGLFLEHDGNSKVCLGKRILPLEEDKEAIRDMGVLLTFIVAAPTGPRTWYRATTWSNAVYMEYAVSWEITVFRYSATGWSASFKSPGNPFPVTFSFDKGA
jgi:hypothetical protein